MVGRGSRQEPLNAPSDMADEMFATYPSLRGKVVVVTGGGSGIGAVIVEHFARQGARVGLLDIADDAAHALVASLADAPYVPVYLRCDVTDITALRAALATLAATLGTVTVLVNNAASDDRHVTAEVTPEYWDARMAINLRHVFFATQAVANGMIEAGGGSIVNIGSIAWLIPSTNQAAYVTAKAGLTGLTRTLAREYGPATIRVNCVLPGAIMTERQRRLWVTPEYAAEINAAQAIKRELVPADIARFVLFLAADDSSAMTSQSYIVDGGWI